MPDPSLAALRIVDAAANRATEGLRTVEDYARFVLEDRFLTESLKGLRHDLQGVLAMLSSMERFASRAVTSDCGVSISTPTELQRADVQAVVQAAAGRVQESLRSIEEYGKTLSGFGSAQIESIRYRAYTLLAAVQSCKQRSLRLQEATLYLLMPTSRVLDDFKRDVDQLYAAGVDVIQLRDKQCDDRTLYQFAKAAAEIARRRQKLFIVNDRCDIALAVNASGVHLGQEELPIEDARRLLGADRLIGISTHDIDQVAEAVLKGADYIGCGPTFPSETKRFEAFAGLPFLQQVAASHSVPAFAIGGIQSDNLNQVLETGFTRVAVAGAILKAVDPVAAVAAMKRQLTLR